MNILQLAQKPQRRGAEIFAVQLGDWLVGGGHRLCHAYLYAYPGANPLPVEKGHVCLGRKEGSVFERLPCGNPRILAGLHRLVRDFQPDIVQANGGRSVKYAALLAITSPGRSWKLVYRNIDSPRFWVRGAARKVYFRHLVMPRVDGVVGVSRRTLDEVYAFYRLSAPGEFIPNGIDLGPLSRPADREEVRRRLGITPELSVVLFFGTLTGQKRPDRFVRLIGRLRESGQDVVGWVLGDGEARSRTKELAGKLGVESSVHFLGYRDRVADYVAAADLLASTSDSEGIPAAVLEAGYLRLPVVGYAVGGMPECVLHGETGLLAPAGDETEHLRLTLDLLRDPGERRRMGEAARAFVESRFSMDVVGRCYERFYERLLTGKRSVSSS